MRSPIATRRARDRCCSYPTTIRTRVFPEFGHLQGRDSDSPARASKRKSKWGSEAMATEKTDVVIVGVGAAGGILAAELGKAGMKVIGLERGPPLTTHNFDPHDELRDFRRQDLRPNIKRQPITWRPNANAPATAIPVQNYGNQAGGGTVH